MSKTKLEHELTKDELEDIQRISEWDKEKVKQFAEALSMMIRAFEGKPIEPDDIISKFTNIKNLLERSRFPTYVLLQKQVYLRLIALKNPAARSLEKWATKEAEALISYKGKSREEYVDTMKSQAARETQEFYLGQTQPQQPQVKRRFWQRKPKEQTEFANQ